MSQLISEAQTSHDLVKESLAEGNEKQALIDRFTVLVDQALASEEPPEGIAPEIWDELSQNAAEDPGQYGLWAAMTSLTQEVRLQGRAFKQLDDTLLPLRDQMQGHLSNHEETSAQAREMAEQAVQIASQRAQDLRREAEDRCRAELLSTLLDVHERLGRGIESCRASRQSIVLPRFGWLAGGKELKQALEALESLEDGYVLGIQSLEEQLQRHHVQTIDCQGCPFEPSIMNAVAVEETRSHPEGTVLEVLRPGYTCKGTVFRVAQVKVARNSIPALADNSKEKKV